MRGKLPDSGNLRGVLFDLDDTLYEEMAFVRSGFRAASGYLRAKFGLDQAETEAEFVRILQRNGRSGVFDTFVRQSRLCGEETVNMLVHVYRTHTPDISLDEDVAETLDALRRRGLRIGLVSDGMASVQRRKVDALRLEHMCDAVVFSDELGAKFWKPSTAPFLVALELLAVAGDQAAYVGDNIAKDFAGPNRLGMTSIRILRHKDERAREMPAPEGGECLCAVDRIEDLLTLFGPTDETRVAEVGESLRSADKAGDI